MGHSLEFTILDYKEILKLFLKIKYCSGDHFLKSHFKNI